MRSATSKTALLRFVRAATPSGRPYKDIRLPLDALRQPPQGSTTTVPYIRGGCRAGAARPGADALMPPPQAGAPNDLRYPQLVPSDTCALCKRQLPPLNRSPNPDWLLPTAVATPERLQCERCKRVRYCSAWCAHMHYEAAHKYLCPLPPFSSEFNACYVIRSGRRVRSFPVRCIARGETSINPELHQAARGYAWTAVRHETDPTRAKCSWCLREPSDMNAPQLHNVWFVALITRIASLPVSLSAEEIDWDTLPSWRPPLTVFGAIPSVQDQRVSWPQADPLTRYREDNGGCGLARHGLTYLRPTAVEVAPRAPRGSSGDSSGNPRAHRSLPAE